MLTGGGRGLLASAGADERLIGARPALVTGETFAVLEVDADWWVQRLCERASARIWEAFAGGLRRDGEDGVVVLRHADAAFDSQVWTAWATELLAAGETLALIGTRGLLGEGWDCPPVNVLVDMTAVAADVSVRQMRGRSLRLDPADPAKLANNWDVVCVAPALGRGHADYGRFVRRHAHLHAPCEDGTIETGPSHVHPELSPYGPPSADRFVAINIEQQERAADRDAARARWSVGVPYRGVDLDVLVVRNPRRASPGEPPAALAAVHPPPWRWLAARRGYPEQLPLEWAAGAVCDAYVALGELPAEVAATMGFSVRPEGWVRVSLPDAEVEISRRVSAALDELFGGGALPRYVVSRKVATSPVPFLGRRTAWHAVPADLARRKERAAAFHVAWQRWLGGGELVYCHGTDARARDLAVQRRASPRSRRSAAASGGKPPGRDSRQAARVARRPMWFLVARVYPRGPCLGMLGGPETQEPSPCARSSASSCRCRCCSRRRRCCPRPASPR